MTSRKVLVLAVITEILDTTISYPSCVRCHSKLLVDPTTSRYHCVKCGTSCDKCKVQWRYKLVVSVSDKTCLGRVVIFGRCLDGFFGKTATDFTRSLDDLERTGYPAKSMLAEALLRTFLGKYFYFGFKASDVCDTVRPIALKDVLNLDVSLPQSQLDCTSNFDNSHTLAHQILASSDAVFASVTDHMRIMVKQLRNQRTVLNKTEVNPCDTNNQSNNNKQPEYMSYRTLGSISGTTSFELGLDSVHFSFETSSKATGTNEKFEHRAQKTNSSINQTDLSVDSLCEIPGLQERVMVAADVVRVDPAECLSYVTVSMFDDDNDNDSFVSNHNFNVENITHDQCVTLSDLPVTQKLLFDSPNASIGSNTSKKIDKELFRREILNSHAFTLDQFSCLSGTSYFHADNCNATLNCRKTAAGPKKTACIRECDSAFKHFGAGFLQNQTTTDVISLSSASLLRNKPAAELAMPESEDLNAFFDSQFEGIVFTQDNEGLDADNAESPKCTSKVSDNGDNELAECDNSKCDVVNSEEPASERTKADYPNGKNNATVEHLAAECIEQNGKIENRHKPTTKYVPDLNEPLTKKFHETNEGCSVLEEINNCISQSLCGNLETFPEAEHFSDSFEEHFFENDLDDIEIKAVTESINHVNIDATNIDKESCKIQVSNKGHVFTDENKIVEHDKDLELFFADISNYEIDKTEVEDHNEKVNLVDKDLDTDLEEFFADISKFEVDEHQIDDGDGRIDKDDKNVKKCFGEYVGTGIPNDDNVSDGANWYDLLMNSGASDLDTDINVDSLRVADTPEFIEQSPESDNDVISVDTGTNCAGQRFKSDNDTDERLMKNGQGSNSHFHFDFLTSGSSCKGSPNCYKQIKAPNKSTSFKNGSYNSRKRNIGKVQNSEQNCDGEPHASGTNKRIVNYSVANSFDASNDLFESSGGIGSDNDSPDKCAAIDGFVSDSFNDESVWKDGPLGASTPAADQCIIFDSLEYIEVESDSEIEVAKNSEDKKMVKFDPKLRRVSSCNFIDLKMRVNESPLVRQDHNRLLKSCLKLPKRLNKTLMENQTDIGDENITSAEKFRANVSQSNLEISNGFENSYNASADLFGDSSKASEGNDCVSESEMDLKEGSRGCVLGDSSPKNVSFSEHWSDDVSENILLEAIDVIEDKENNSEEKVTKCRVGKASCNQEERYKISTLKKSEMKNKVMKNIGFEETSWSPDIFESQTLKNESGPQFRVNNIVSTSDPYVKKIGPIKCKFISKENITEQTRCTDSDKKAAVLLNDRCQVLKCLPVVLNTPDCADVLGAKNAQKERNSGNQSNDENINITEHQSSFYSPDLFFDSILDFTDDNVVCDRTNDVLCKKMLF